MFFPYRLHNESDAHYKYKFISHCLGLACRRPVKGIDAQNHSLYIAPLQIYHMQLVLEIEQDLL